MLFEISADSKVRKIEPFTNGKFPQGANLDMSDILLDFEKKVPDFKLKVTESLLSYINQQCSVESEIALSIYIPSLQLLTF